MKLEKKEKKLKEKILHKKKSASLNSVPELIEIESWMLLNFFISMKFYIFHCHVCLNVCLSTYKKEKKTLWPLFMDGVQLLQG